MNKHQPLVFVSLPVADLSKSIAFYEAIGFTHNKQFSDQTGACMNLSDTFSVMLITHGKWREFTTRAIPDAKKTAQLALIIMLETKDAVIKAVENGAKAGGVADPNPIEDMGFMYGRSLEDPDGHIVEPKWMDASAMNA